MVVVKKEWMLVFCPEVAPVNVATFVAARFPKYRLFK